jgi:hypothetical protein
MRSGAFEHAEIKTAKTKARIFFMVCVFCLAAIFAPAVSVVKR